MITKKVMVFIRLAMEGNFKGGGTLINSMGLGFILKVTQDYYSMGYGKWANEYSGLIKSLFNQYRLRHLITASYSLP